MAAALALLVILIILISSCVRGCSAQKADEQSAQTTAATEMNSQDSRVAAGVSSEVTSQFTTALNRDDELTWIAANASQYPSERMLILALNEPSAIDYVYNYPNSDKSAQAYSDAVTKGTFPQLYDWDSRWGNVTYGNAPIGVTGSGPTCLSMAYMGLLGKSDKTPADLATLATNDGLATGEEGTSGDFFTKEASGLGLACTQYEATEDNLVSSLSNNDVVIVEVKAGTISTTAHWALVVGRNDNGSAILYDPTSESATNHEWDTATIASICSSFYSLAVAG